GQRPRTPQRGRAGGPAGNGRQDYARPSRSVIAWRTGHYVPRRPLWGTNLYGSQTQGADRFHPNVSPVEVSQKSGHYYEGGREQRHLKATFLFADEAIPGGVQGPQKLIATSRSGRVHVVRK